MTSLSSLSEDPNPLVIDTSVLINLHASGKGVEILLALPNRLVLTNVVEREIRNETSRGGGEIQFVDQLLSAVRVERAVLSGAEQDAFEELVGRTPTLDDGEASVIAVAQSRGFSVVMDELRGRKRAVGCSVKREPWWSINLLYHPDVVERLGAIELAQAIYLSLRNGRMRIPETVCDDIVSVIGMRRALDCNSLPGFKSRRPQWQALLTASAGEIRKR